MIDPTIFRVNGSTAETARLIISVDPKTGEVNINGPIQDRIFCFGILELAKQAINAHADQQAKRILVAQPIPILKSQ